MQMSQIKIDCFKAYDVRGRVPDQINEDIAYRIGRAFVQFLGAKSVVVGHDIRLSSPELSAALVRGLREQGNGKKQEDGRSSHLGLPFVICSTSRERSKRANSKGRVSYFAALLRART